MMHFCHGWCWQPPQTASHLHIRHIQNNWAHWYAIHGHTVSALHRYTYYPPCLAQISGCVCVCVWTWPPVGIGCLNYAVPTTRLTHLPTTPATSYPLGLRTSVPLGENVSWWVSQGNVDRTVTAEFIVTFLGHLLVSCLAHHCDT